MTVVEDVGGATLFVANVLNGTVAASPTVVLGGTVDRIRLSITPRHAPIVASQTIIGTGFAEHTDPAALVVGPTGVRLASDGTLYIADSGQQPDRIDSGRVEPNPRLELPSPLAAHSMIRWDW